MEGRGKEASGLLPTPTSSPALPPLSQFCLKHYHFDLKSFKKLLKDWLELLNAFKWQLLSCCRAALGSGQVFPSHPTSRGQSRETGSPTLQNAAVHSSRYLFFPTQCELQLKVASSLPWKQFGFKGCCSRDRPRSMGTMWGQLPVGRTETSHWWEAVEDCLMV